MRTLQFGMIPNVCAMIPPRGPTNQLNFHDSSVQRPSVSVTPTARASQRTYREYATVSLHPVTVNQTILGTVDIVIGIIQAKPTDCALTSNGSRTAPRAPSHLCGPIAFSFHVPPFHCPRPYATGLPLRQLIVTYYICARASLYAPELLYMRPSCSIRARDALYAPGLIQPPMDWLPRGETIGSLN